MKYILVFIILFICSVSYSQSDVVERNLEKFETLYKLDKSQVQLVKELLISKEAKMTALLNAEGEKKEKRIKRKAIHEAYENRFVEILNEEQKEAHEKIKAANEALKVERREKRSEAKTNEVKESPKDGIAPSSK